VSIGRIKGVTIARYLLLSQPVIPYRALISFDISVLLRLSRLDELWLNPVSFGPVFKQFTVVFRAGFQLELSDKEELDGLKSAENYAASLED